jgi:histidyl-tRNA synthetase
VIDKLDKIGPEKTEAELVALGIPQKAAQAVLIALTDLNKFAHLVSNVPEASEASANIAAIMTLADATPAKGHVKFTPRLARGLSYYTGAIMEVAVPDLAGSLGGGGRYDGLIGMFSGEQIPACGFSLGLERILVVMGERGMFPESVRTSGPDVLVTIFDNDLVADSLRLAGELRAEGFRVELYPELLRAGKDLGKAFRYADARQARFVTVLGPGEANVQMVKIKDMATGQQGIASRSAVAISMRESMKNTPASNFLPPAPTQ